MFEAIGAPQISVVVPSYNSAGTILGTISRLLQQTLPPTEIIVVDDGSTDSTREVLRPVAEKINYLYQPNKGPAAARNFGIKASVGEFIAFTDSDCLPDKEWLANLMSGFHCKKVAGVGGAVKSIDQSTVGRHIDLARILEPKANESGQVPYLVTCNACFRRTVLLEVGLFDERFHKPGGEEPELCQRITDRGYQFCWRKEAKVLHYHRQTVFSFLRTLANYGEGLYLHSTLRPERKLKQPLKLFLRQCLAIRSACQDITSYVKTYGRKAALAFVLLNYLRPLAYIGGYLRGKWRHA